MPLEVQRIFEQVTTSRLILRTPSLEDAPAVFSIEGDPETNKYRPTGPMVDLGEAVKTIDRWREDWLTNGYGYWSIVIPRTSELVGIGGIRKMIWREQDILNLYYRFAPKAWGNGYATEVARVAVQMAVAYLPELPVVARIRPENSASIRVAQRVGLERRKDLDTDEHLVFAAGWSNQG
ncbi:GNAT family N-acetyltransferase [Alicyclobacillus acidoterrestris]|uniref:GNAT family N-acetyltransferase n=1 Tax=Alicyclobacillus acidoterrestris (strain ATCC 49025 / DSM 3922 / CIP 106132 / NCIMB 13137 / GD3B) TaxID=1356854 RepID=T0D2Z7_ALIAG|nr:GNAT family N-acetyltransferase [Alicyclobacillus acidoterrestris]EPZ44101.1 hypothetical protein N007_11300 [Alicyclobacillus acidoterrestris ATCC 49025]UNO49626.1 GNAT family N-acetyltransferase [Alicyclobacillus acidoterrestris]